MKVLSAVVTHNRKALLSRCLDHLLAQRDASLDVLVVNNGSTDGTVEMLAERGVEVVTQDNVGSAGGWHRGIAEALARGYDAVWLMDDDGFPDPGALAVLLKALTPGVACASSVVLREDVPDSFVFPFPKLDRHGHPRIFAWPRKYARLNDLQAVAQGGTYPFAHLFNGALVSIRAVREVGNVDQAYFIYGDEVDYFHRLRNSGSVISVLAAKHYHPDASGRAFTPEKIYYYLRNSIAINHRHMRFPIVNDMLTLSAIFGHLKRRNGIRGLLSYLVGANTGITRKAVVDGVRLKLGKTFHG